MDYSQQPQQQPMYQQPDPNAQYQQNPNAQYQQPFPNAQYQQPMGQPGYQQPQVYVDPSRGSDVVYQNPDQQYPQAIPGDMAIGEKTDKELEKDDQMMFVRKVLGIVAGQLIVTFVILIGASYSEGGFGDFCRSLGCFITSIFVYMFSIIALLCSKGLRHSVPFNYIVLLIFTLSLSFMVAGITAYLTPESVIMAIGVLMLVLTSMATVFMCIENKAQALKGLLIAMFAAVMVQLILMVSLMFSGYIEGIWILYCTMGVILCAGLIYFDLFIIMLAGKYAMDEYIYCAVLLYVDIIRMLIYLLMIFGKAK